MINLPSISWNYLKAKPLNTALNTLILALGISIVTVLMLLSHQVEQKLESNAKGIDLVVGAKGSPLQIILCSIFHIDFPTGNIGLDEAKKLAGNPMVEKAIPLALGDSYKGFRLVGTNHQYTEHYSAMLADGKLWQTTMEATLGSQVAAQLGLTVGDEFFGSHGIGATSHAHEDKAYKVVGILSPSKTVIDNLILTNVESVWAVHGHEEEAEEHEHEHEEGEKHEHDHEAEHEHEEGEKHEHRQTADNQTDSAATQKMLNAAGGRMMGTLKPREVTNFPDGNADDEITSMLLKFRTPMAKITMPRIINEQTNMQAASPPFEIARLLKIVGVGTDLIRGFAFLMVGMALLSIFVGLYNALKERKYELAVMRSLGASKFQLFAMVVMEGLFITLISTVLGLFLGHALLEGVGTAFADSDNIGLTGKMFLTQELWWLLWAMLVGFVASLIPALQAYKTDISTVLAQG